MEFSEVALYGGLIANICAAFKASENHKVMHDEQFVKRLNSVENQFAVSTLASLFASIPLVFLYPMYLGKDPVAAFNDFTGFLTGSNKEVAMKAIFFSGMSFYLYNEFATKSLKKLSTVSSSVANTAKRVFVIVAGEIIYWDMLSPLSLC